MGVGVGMGVPVGIGVSVGVGESEGEGEDEGNGARVGERMTGLATSRSVCSTMLRASWTSALDAARD